MKGSMVFEYPESQQFISEMKGDYLLVSLELLVMYVLVFVLTNWHNGFVHFRAITICKNAKVKLMAAVEEQLLGILDKYPCEPSHYAPQYEGNSCTMSFNGILSIAHFNFEDFLKCGSDHDCRVYAQFKHMRYLPGFSPKWRKPSAAKYE